MEQSPSWESDSHSASQEIRLLRNPKAQYRVYVWQDTEYNYQDDVKPIWNQSNTKHLGQDGAPSEIRTGRLPTKFSGVTVRVNTFHDNDQ
jgi:hypothetical protein